MSEQKEAIQALLDNVRNTVKSIAAEDKLTIVIAKEAAIYQDESLDITPKVLKKMSS